MNPDGLTPGPAPRTVRAADGRVHDVPADWILLPPGDAGLTRRVKAAGDYWAVSEKRGRKVFSRGLWAPATAVDQIRAELDAERATPGFAKKMESAAKRRAAVQAEYVEDFRGAVVRFLAFPTCHAPIAEKLADAVSAHATPVGSGTVARTRRIPIEERAAAAVIAWMRHATTGYDSLAIPRVKGRRREVRRMLAARSRELLDLYRRGAPIPDGCPLRTALG